MQTFLPYPDFEKSAACLDYKRLGKQRVEAYQIINVLVSNKTEGGWVNHPAVRMWRGHIAALQQYYNTIVTEWISRGYKNNMRLYSISIPDVRYPLWLGDEKFHASHRSNLLRKFPEHYGKFGWKESSNLPYIWPV
jgi:hypothetical protein